MFASNPIPIFSLEEQDVNLDTIQVGHRNFNKELLLKRHGVKSHPELQSQEYTLVKGISWMAHRPNVKLNEPRTIQKTQKLSLSTRHHNHRMNIMNPSRIETHLSSKKDTLKTTLNITTPFEESLKQPHSRLPQPEIILN